LEQGVQRQNWVAAAVSREAIDELYPDYHDDCEKGSYDRGKSSVHYPECIRPPPSKFEPAP
jgi:hypothetical protein